MRSIISVPRLNKSGLTNQLYSQLTSKRITRLSNLEILNFKKIPLTAKLDSV